MTTQQSLIENYGQNIWSPTLRREPIDRNSDDLIEELRIHGQRVCRNSISESYIYESLQEFTDGYVYYDDSEDGSPILGFAIWGEKHNRTLKAGGKLSSLYIYLICTQKNDKRLCTKIMYDIEVAALDRKINVISLHAIDDETVSMYKHYGYKLDKEDTLEMSKIIIVAVIHRKQRNHTRRAVQRHKKTLKRRYNHLGEPSRAAYDNTNTA
jgi:CRISPR/Cas system-associated protein Csx1